MELGLEAVIRVFDDVLNGRMSRERADRWAYAVVQEEETGVVKYSPPGERERIWAGVMYLYGIDAMTGPDAYLHSGDDIREAMIECFGGVVDPTTTENLPAIERPPQYLGADSAPL
jgi:hypothetical protein